MFSTTAVWLFAAAGIDLALAGFVFAVGAGQSWNRAFALLMVIHAALRIIDGLFEAVDLGAHELFWGRLGGYFGITDDLVLLYFVSIFPRRAPWMRYGAAPFLAAGGLLVLLHASLPRGFDAPAGPLFLTDLLLTVVAYGAAPAWLAWQAWRSDARSASAYALTAAGLSAWSVYVNIRFFAPDRMSALADAVGHGVPIWFFWLLVAATACALELQIVAAVFLGRATRGPQRPIGPRIALALLATAAATGFTRTAWPDYPTWLGFSMWILIGSLVIAYSLLRYQLIDIDLKVKEGVRRSAIVAPFAVAFVVGSELLEQFVPVDGQFLGIAAAGVIALGLRPLHTWSGRLADRLLPDVEDTKEYREHRGEDMYRATFTALMSDGVISAKERQILLKLAGRVGLGDDEVQKIERATA